MHAAGSVCVCVCVCGFFSALKYATIMWRPLHTHTHADAHTLATAHRKWRA